MVKTVFDLKKKLQLIWLLSLQFWLQIYQKKTPPSGADLKMLYKKNWTILGQNTNCLAHFGAQLKFSEALRKVKKVTI